MIKPVDPRRAIYNEILKAMRKRQRDRRQGAVKLRDFAGNAETQESALKLRKQSDTKHDEADGMAELILMVKNMRDGGAP